MVAGIISAAAGLAICFTVSRIGGVIVLMIGISLLVMTFSVSNFFYRIKMKELFEGNSKNK